VSVSQGLFILLAVLAVGGAGGVAVTRNLFHAALFLVLSLAGVAGLYVLLDAGFLAAVQVLVYVGAIAILIIFAVMLSHDLMARGEPRGSRRWWPAASLGTALAAVLGVMLVRLGDRADQANGSPASLEQLGAALVGPYALPFELASVLLLAALIGAVLLARETG
jgi:NADH-quinone oxidoreductase subunit J